MGGPYRFLGGFRSTLTDLVSFKGREYYALNSQLIAMGILKNVVRNQIAGKHLYVEIFC
jgi:hypothetical protein